MNSSSKSSSSVSPRHTLAAACRRLAPMFLILGLAATVRGQVEVIYDWNSGNDIGWGHYEPGSGLGQMNTRSFPTNSPGDQAYRQFSPGTTCANIITRGGAYRSEQYQEFFQSVEINSYDANRVDMTMLFGSRINPPSPSAPGQLTGYVTAYAPGNLRARQGFLGCIEFTAEITSNFMDLYRGGAAPVTYIPPSRKTRLVFSGLNDTFKAELYDVTDLLEPLTRINFQDATGNASVHTSGENLIGWLNLEFEEQSDFTWDNYHSTATRTTAVGFPGTPQVVNLVPAPQTLFYTIPTTNKITFTATTFNTNQIARNAMKLLRNDVDVSSQLVSQEVITPLIGSPKTNFTVRWNGSLSSNTVYHGQIRVLDPSGKGTTNNWYFDTFPSFNPTDPSNPSGFLLVEAEDYNYTSGGIAGQYQDYPPVSGTDDTTTSVDPIFDVSCACTPAPTDTLGPQVNGGGLGYYDQSGTPETDYHDSRGNADVHQRSQYRTMDYVGTVQGTKGGGMDTPRSYRMHLSNSSGGTNSYVPDYIIADMQAGDWMNYTRKFPNGNYNVYLRASSQGRQDVRLDEVTANANLHDPDQVKVLRGQFLVPNTQGLTRWRYVPLTDEAGNLQTIHLGGTGVTNTLRLTANQVRDGITPVQDGDRIGDLQLNWILFVPVTNSASSQPFIASASPSANSDNFGPKAAVNIVILNRSTAVSCPGSIQLRFDNVNVTSSATITCTTSEGAGATVSYQPPGFLLPNSTHSVSLVFSDGSTTQSNQWNFTVEPNTPLLTLGDAVGGVADSLFTIQMNKATNGPTGVNGYSSTACEVQGPFEDWIPRAELQLAGLLINADTTMPYPNEAAGTTAGFYSEPLAVNYEQAGNDFDQNNNRIGLFSGHVHFPGIGPSDPGWNGGDPDHIAMAATIKLQLAAGVYRMGVSSDDEFEVTAGESGGTNVFLASSVNTLPRDHNDGQFDFVVQSNGVYKFRLVYEEGGGASHCEWYWVNQTTGARRLISLLTIPASTCCACVGGDRGFVVKMAKAPNSAPDSPDFDDTPARAEAQLAGTLLDTNGVPYINEAAGANNGFYTAPLINFNQNGCCAGLFGADAYFPGVGPTDPGWNNGDPNHMAMAATTFLDLTAGRHIFGVRSDDGFRVFTGATAPFTNVIVGAFDGPRGRFATEFEFIAPASGLYPFRLLYYEGVGGADCEFYSVDPATGTPTLINDPTNPNAVKAYQKIGVPLLNVRVDGSGMLRFDYPTCTGHTYTVEYKNSLTDVSWTALGSPVVGDGTTKTAGPFGTTNPVKRFYHVKVN